MAVSELTVTLKATPRWWLMPFLKLAGLLYAFAGCDVCKARCTAFIVKHGLKIEVKGPK